MKRYLKLISITIVTRACQALAQTPTDDALFKKASALVALHECDSAMQTVQTASAGCRESAAYYHSMAEVYECKGKNDYAVIYYKKALAIDTGDTLAKERVERLSPSLQAETVLPTKKRRRLSNIDNGYVAWGLNFCTMTGGSKRLYHYGQEMSIMAGTPLFHNKAMLDFTLALGAAFEENTNWWHIPIYKGLPAPATVGSALLMGGDASLGYMLVNKKHFSATAGLAGGIQLLAGPYYLKNGSGAPRKSPVFVCLGPRVACYVRKRWCFAAEYLHYGLGGISATIDQDAPAVPVNLDLIRIDAGIRID